MTIVIASHNEGKVKELATLLSGAVDIQFKSMNDFADLKNLDIEETGATYQHNAQLKAKIVAKRTGLPTIADDSGLEIRALDNFPGIKSARWMPGTDDERNRGLLNKMTNIKFRAAQFVATLCFFDPDTKFESCVEGVLKGKIAHAPLGAEGFGYDPIFIPETSSLTLAQMGIEQKNQISHRSQACKKMGQLLSSKYGKL